MTETHVIQQQQTTSSTNYQSRFKKDAKAKTTLFRLPGFRHLEMNVSRRE